MSAYTLQRAVFDRLRAGERGRPEPSDDGYELSGAERAALLGRDLRALTLLGVHPVLLNAFARSCGITRDGYRAMLTGTASAVEGSPRWRAS
ncbi:hypothetical protein [Streptomyces sp. CB03238]|uniref:hypothetical protein n=1 Tax=Streptomyces sp. CB03238 TaxID=1907777 RepID=UPI000A0F5A33|nr:hypothetical protein [Streptomyces sp. CB03238]ORT56525.1 hypothetical protein BKD26_27310 [Streptomyces sp. CB03238]